MNVLEGLCALRVPFFSILVCFIAPFTYKLANQAADRKSDKSAERACG